MTEDFLHYLWKFKRLDFQNLQSTAGEPVQIIETGEHNHHAGPDFLNARIKIGDTIWAGNIEIHIAASDWYKHGHQHDKAYDNIVLHVVYHSDDEIKRKDGQVIPCLEIRERFNQGLYSKYLWMLENNTWIPCGAQIGKVDGFIMDHWLERLMVERLETKTGVIQASLELNKNHWEDTFYQLLARNFGMKTNATAFELLAKSLPLKVLAKHKVNLAQLEALLFGQAGFLEDIFRDDYPRQLQEEYAFLQKKYNLVPIKKHLWKFLRLRPANFPTIRIAQFGRLVHNSSHLFSKIVETENVRALCRLFEADVSGYWLDHYKFDKVSAKRKKTLGKSAVDNILINTIVPFLFYYGKTHDSGTLKERALELLREVRPEKNHITKNWEQVGVAPKSAFHSQALIQLYNGYCKHKKCLYCNVGNHLLREAN